VEQTARWVGEGATSPEAHAARLFAKEGTTQKAMGGGSLPEVTEKNPGRKKKRGGSSDTSKKTLTQSAFSHKVQGRDDRER